MNSEWINICYILAAILFVLGIKMLGRAETARRGNAISAVGMLLAVVVTLLAQGLDYKWIVAGLGLGSLIGVVAARWVKMTSMPEMVALFNGFGGLASVLVGWVEYDKITHLGWEPYLEQTGAHPVFTRSVIVLTLLIGAVTFTGSMLAWAKLSEKIKGAAIVFPAQKLLNLFLCVVIVGAGFAFVAFPEGYQCSVMDTCIGEGGMAFLLAVLIFALALGVLGVIPIGGGDMPVVIALLNSFSGLAASAAGFVIGNTVLVVAGSLVGASGLILTVIMCKAMNRTLSNVLFSGFGATAQKASSASQGEMKGMNVEDAYYVLEAARSVVIVPGYGMAVAQAQHAVKELGELLEANGAEVRYAIHPVAGRMPGHMNVLLAEADVSYDALAEMHEVNPIMPTVDVAIVIGANDVVNPAALCEPDSPIFGMPIIQVHEAKTVFALKRGRGAGFSGLENSLFFKENTRMLFGDAKSTVTRLVAQFKDA